MGELRKQGIWNVLHRLQFNRLKRVLSRFLNWSKPLPGRSAGFCFFLAADLVWQFFVALHKEVAQQLSCLN